MKKAEKTFVNEMKQAKHEKWSRQDADHYAERIVAGMVVNGEKAKKTLATMIAEDPMNALGYAASYAETIVEGSLAAQELPVVNEAGVRAVLDVYSRKLLEGFGETVPNSTSAFHNAACLARAEGIRKFIRNLKTIVAFYNDVE